ncbi:DUF4350 domain-containing protein [Amycolatopsis taiwanensis]|uniref:DUF4350 domain-containing protein n=1 Tax=Amycolatopsis taiwanensis TaxID=342230 RepID=A0A9W6R462_9PSEU|nr:DUF4350 domain-containing protein [Amycolatopsis taiwanensis]GLY68248.1 hypothetical protein Atai01_48670 [Amycolatopsis taiwanensis]
MSAPHTSEAGAGPLSTPTSPDAKRVWRAARAPIFIAVVILLGASLVLLIRGDTSHGDLDPGSAEPGGSRALANLLTQQGVRVVGVRTFADAEAELSPDATLLVTGPGLVEPGRLAELRSHAGEAVLVGARQQTLDAVLPGVSTMPESDVGVRSPDCTVAAAVAAGDVLLGGVGYQAHQSARGCYAGSLLQVGRTTLLGSGAPLTNENLATEGNAALTMRLLGRSAKLVWYQPASGDQSAGLAQRSFLDLVPRGWLYGAVEVGVAAVLFALWRGRRLGPVVAEPLPVVVRAAETVEGRARLYRRSRSSAHAAHILRQAVVDRLRPTLGLGAAAEPAAVVSSIAARSGKSPAEVGALLYGPAPGDDASLVRLADELDRLTREVR